MYCTLPSRPARMNRRISRMGGMVLKEMAHHQNSSAIPREVYEGLPLLHAKRQRLLDEDVLAGG